MDLTIPHIHLLMNHVPTVGTVAALGLLLLSLIRRNEHLLRAALEVLFVVALLTLPVYLSGVAAGSEIQELDGVAAGAISTHETAALLAFLWMQITGFFAWLALWQGRRLERLPRASVGAVVALALLTTALMGRAATIGGEIRHPEILAGPASATVASSTGWLRSAAIADFVTNYPWVWPAAEALHFLGLCLVLGVLLAVNLRILGAMKVLSFASLHRLLPWGMLGFALNLVTGMLFFIAAASQYTGNIAFLWKVIFLAVTGAHFLYLTVFSNTWALKDGAEAASLDRFVAAGGIGAWVAVIYWGRMLPFIGNAF
jgi:hypothetical protein